MIALVAALALGGTPDASQASHPWYARRAYHGWFSCMSGESQRPKSGRHVVVLAPGHTPRQARIERVLDREGWPEPEEESGYRTTCFRKFQHGEGEWVARLQLPEPLDSEVFIALAPPASGLTVVGGRRTRLRDADARRIAASVGARVERGMLVDAYRYGAGGPHEAVELYLGLPVLNGPGALPPIRSVEIRRLFVIDGVAKAEDARSRRSGVEERVDNGIIELTKDNWSASQSELTAGFLTRDGGASWDRLSVDVGFEGLWWRAQALRKGLPVLYEKNLYTTH